ncbi:MAG TPA: 2-dehydropantoate 2-reductase N-terminal domain-containing protein [Galbitalea sp.]|jgi:2-dehydropantoate 2-reductase|nr:2-dehydropantoate 2-reductase N-terminal domain-containing protein [Galbitalea sp.]
MRYVIIGAGAIGGVLGARLAQGSGQHPPLLVARGKHGAAIARDGLRLRTPDQDVTVRPVVASGPDQVQLQSDDVLVMAVKTQQAQAALEQWVDAPVVDAAGERIGTAGELLPILLAMNGVESERLALRMFARVYAACVWMPAVHLTPGEVISRIAPVSGTFIIGRYASELDAADRDLLGVLESDWSASSFTVHIVDDPMRWKYAKLLGNLANAVQALVKNGGDFGPLAERLRAEAEGIYRASGISWASEAEEATERGDVFSIRPVPGAPTDLGGSTWQSFARGAGSIETDYLNGEIALMARLRALRAPLNEAVQRLAREAVASGSGVGSMTVAELSALLP